MHVERRLIQIATREELLASPPQTQRSPNMVMTIAPFGLAIRSAPSGKDRRIACQNAGLWQNACLTPVHLSWQGVATHVDATETETDYKLRIDLPGFSPEEVDIELQGNKLNITAKKEDSKGTDKAVACSRAISFSRSFGLPDNVREADISASLDKGVLTVTLPKAQPGPKAEPKTVPVQAGPAKAAAAEAAGPAAAADKGVTAVAQGNCTYRPWGRFSK